MYLNINHFIFDSFLTKIFFHKINSIRIKFHYGKTKRALHLSTIFRSNKDYKILTKGMQGITLSYFCSALRFAMPPHNREVPRTRRRLESMEPRREYLTTSILLLLSANIAMMSSVAFPHVAFKSPPTMIQNITIKNFSIIS